MKIIEAMKELKLLEKRIGSNREQITRYASYASIDDPIFDKDPEIQRKELSSLVQANFDLIEYYLELKERIQKTNLETKVTIGGVSRSISQLITLRTGSGRAYIDTLQALNANTAMNRLNQVKQIDMSNPPKAILLWDEKEKNEQLKHWQYEVLDKIDSTLEIVNATTDLLD